MDTPERVVLAVYGVASNRERGHRRAGHRRVIE
jgi:hypothetical protein